MAYEFPSDIRERLQARLRDGVYRNEDDIIRDAIDALDQIEQERLTRWNERNALAIQQSEQGLSKPLDDEQIPRTISQGRDR
jgi:Arc/MetJ-type ribon-helix-helix transcriptional regulator